MGEELPCDPPSRQAPPNNRRHPPALIGLLRDRTVDGDIEKNPGPEDAQTTGNDIPPQHREMVTRLASEIETASNPHYPAKLYKYATQALTEALQKQRRASTPPLGHSTHAPCAEPSTTHGTLEVPSPEAPLVQGVHGPGTPRPAPLETSELTVKTQKHHSPVGLNMTTAIDVVCPRCNMADFVYFRCTTCKYFAIHQPDTPDLVPRRLYNVMSPDPLYPRQESWQEAIPATTSQTYHTPVPHETGPRPTVEDTPDGWLRDVTSDGDVEPNPGPSPSTPSAKRTRYNQDTPHMYQTPRMLRKRTADNTPPGQKRRRTDHVPMANQEHQSSTLVYNHHKRKADGEPTHQPLPKRHQSTTHWDKQHPLGNQGNLRMKRPYEDTTDQVMGDSPRRKIRRTQRLRNRPYPRPTSWVHDPTQDGDTEPDPGPTTPVVERTAQTTPPGDMGTGVHNALPPLLLAAPPPRQPNDDVHKHSWNTDDGGRALENCPVCLDSPADTHLSCDPRHRLWQDCANDPRLLRCPLCRGTLQPKIPPPPPDDPTYAYFHIQIYNNRLLTYTDHCATPNPPVHVAYNVWRRLPSTTSQLWEVHLRTDLPYYHIARHRLHALTGTREGFHMALSIRYWLFLVQPLQHDLPLEYDTTGWVPPDHPSDVRHDRITSITPDVAYPQHTQWVPDAT